MLGKGVALGHLERSEKQIRMTLPPSVDVRKLLADTEKCGEVQGGPPHDSSLQYRSGEIVLYLQSAAFSTRRSLPRKRFPARVDWAGGSL